MTETSQTLSVEQAISIFMTAAEPSGGFVPPQAAGILKQCRANFIPSPEALGNEITRSPDTINRLTKAINNIHGEKARPGSVHKLTPEQVSGQVDSVFYLAELMTVLPPDVVDSITGERFTHWKNEASHIKTQLLQKPGFDEARAHRMANSQVEEHFLEEVYSTIEAHGGRVPRPSYDPDAY